MTIHKHYVIILYIFIENKFIQNIAFFILDILLYFAEWLKLKIVRIFYLVKQQFDKIDFTYLLKVITMFFLMNHFAILIDKSMIRNIYFVKWFHYKI